MSLKTAFIGKYVEIISSKASPSTLPNSVSVAIVGKTRRDLAVTISVGNGTKENKYPADENLCVAIRVATLLLMSEKLKFEL